MYRSIIIIFIVLWIIAPSGVSAFELKVLGVRGGVSDNRNQDTFYQYEAFLTARMPWDWRMASDWRLGTLLEANAGVLHGDGESAFVGSAGPGISITGYGDKLEIPMGVNLTVISEDTFGDDDFGGPIQFTSHIGLNINVTRRMMIGYRLQHMSNAGLYSSNPGVNIHMLGIGYRF